MENFFFTFTDPDHYDDISRWRCSPDDPRFRRTPQGLVPVPYAPGWTYDQFGIWTVCKPDGHILRKQGWKLHVSVTQHSLETLLPRLSEVCYARGLPFKFLTRREYAWLVNSKYAPRPVSGKGIVIYPPDDVESVELAEELSTMLADADGPRILSDLRIGNSVVHARYGAFTRRMCRDDRGKITLAMDDDEGAPIPDRRSVPFRAPAFVTVPPQFVSPPPSVSGPVPPYRITKTLHFSNGGGVYLATDLENDRPVVLKESRPFAGVDLLGRDSVARAAQEAAAMQKFSDRSEIPRLYDQFTWQEHVFTVMEYVRGTTLQEWCAAKQPYLMRADPFAPPSTDEIADYRGKIEGIIDRLADVLAAIWQQGYAVGDIHPANVMITPDLDVKLLDLEACGPDDEDRQFGGAPGYTDFERRGVDSDRYSFAMLELACYLPLTHLVRMEDSKLPQLLDTCRRRFGLSEQWARRIELACGPTDSGPPSSPRAPVGAESSHLDDRLGFEAWAREIVAGFESVLDGTRSDRLFPCDHTGFGLSPVSLATGASGVLWSLLDTKGVDEAALVDRIVDWITVTARSSTRRLECGLYDSELGAGYALWKAGSLNHAEWMVNAGLAKDRSRCDLSIFSGLSGILLAAIEMSGGPCPLVAESLVEEVGSELIARAQRLLVEMRKAADRDVSQYGLMHGVAGMGLAAHRFGWYTDNEHALDVARQLLEMELSAYVRCADGSLQFNDAERRSLPYLEVGSCGAALVIAEMSDSGDWAPESVALSDLMRPLGPEMIVQCDLFRGRTGFMAGLTQLAARGHGRWCGDFVDRHSRQLGLHEVRQRRGELHYPGAGNFRLSSDLRTGAAGVLTGVAFSTGRRDNWLPGVF